MSPVMVQVLTPITKLHNEIRLAYLLYYVILTHQYDSMIPGQVRVTHPTNVGIVYHSHIPLVKGLIIADDCVLIPNVGWHPCYFIIHECIFQIKFRPVNI